MRAQQCRSSTNEKARYLSYYRLYETGHCHTFNPENVSLAGLPGQHYLNLGLYRRM